MQKFEYKVHFAKMDWIRIPVYLLQLCRCCSF